MRLAYTRGMGNWLTKRRFKEATLREIRAEAGPLAAAHAEIATERHGSRDIYGIATELGIDPSPRNAEAVADAYLRDSPECWRE